MKRILLSFTFYVCSLSAFAQWNGNPTVGTPVVTTSPTTSKTDNVAASDGAGGAYIAWVDNRTATPAIYVQRVLVDGTRKFASEVLVSNASGTTSSAKSNLSIVADGSGGVIIAWQDSRNRVTGLSNDDIYAQRVDQNGNALWTANGVRITVADNVASNKTVPVIELVSSTEAIVVFRDNRLGTPDMFAQKILISNGATQWTNDVAIHDDQVNTQIGQAVLRDGSGGAFIVWEDPRESTSDRNVYGQRINSAGGLLWGTSGMVISNAAFNQLTPQIVSDGSNGIVVTWTDQRLGSGDGNIYAQRLSDLGAIQWAANGVAVATPPLVQSNPLIVRSGSDFIIVWNDQRVAGSGTRDIYAQKIAGTNGSALWATVNGVPVTLAAGNQPNSAGNQVVLEDGSGGAIIVWDDARNGTSALDIYAQRINSDGVAQWTTDGVPVGTAANNQSFPVAVNSVGGAVIVAWRDGRTSTNGEIYAARVQPTGTLPVRSLTVNAVAKASTIEVKWSTIDEDNTASFIVEKSTDAINFYPAGSVKAKGTGNGTYQLIDVRPAEGINYYRVKSVDVNRSYNYSSVIAVSFGNNTKPSVLVYPNPVADVLSLQTTNLSKGNYQVFVRDMTGRISLQTNLTVAAAYQVQTIGLSNLASGTYVLQLVHEGRSSINTVFQKL